MECKQGAQRAIRRLDMRIVANAIKQHQVGAREPLSATFDHLVSGNPVVAADDYAQWNVRLGQGAQPARPVCAASRSEEHTSELQSLMRISYAVFCLKKQKLHAGYGVILDTEFLVEY